MNESPLNVIFEDSMTSKWEFSLLVHVLSVSFEAKYCYQQDLKYTQYKVFFFQVCVSVAMCATSSVLISDSLFPPRSHFHHSSLGRRMRPSKFSFVLLINLQSANWVRASRIHQRTDKSHRWREMLVYRKNTGSNLMIKPVEGGNRKYKWRWVKKCSLWSGVFVRRIISWPDIHQPHK